MRNSRSKRFKTFRFERFLMTALKIPTTKQPGAPAVKYPSACLSGDHIGKVLPVPIPNTEVKLFEPMIVHTSVKVGIAGFLKTLCGFGHEGFFMDRAAGACLNSTTPAAIAPPRAPPHADV